MLWVIARAHVQAITIDEAESYLIWVARAEPSHWVPAANNHLLNSLLTRFFTAVFGASHLTVRAPALMGAAIYTCAAYSLCRLLTREVLLQWLVFVCLVWNPFVLDYMVAARGYSLAVAFLMCAIAIAAHCQRERDGQVPSTIVPCALCSISAALSFAANFSFAFANAATMLIIFLWACRLRTHSLKQRAQVLAACTAPGLLVTLLLSASLVLQWPRGQLWYGATSLHETVSSVVEASLYELNPQIVNPLLYPALKRLAPLLLPALGALCLTRLIQLLLHRRSRRETNDRWPEAFGAALSGILLLSLGVHWLSFRLFHLLLPRGRTALYVVPLATLIIGAIAAIPSPSRAGRLCRLGLISLLFFTGVYFFLCLRLTYFKEWKWNADVNTVYRVVSCYNRIYGVKDIVSSWQYVSALNFYRKLSGDETIPEFVSVAKYPAAKEIYVLDQAFGQGFIAEQGLRVVYRGELSRATIAIRPELEAESAAKPCSVPIR